MGDRYLRDADELLVPSVREMVGELDPPAADKPLVTLALTMAATIDAMAPAVRDAMLPQHAGPLLRALREIEDRARRRRAATRSGRPGKVAQIRSAHAQATKKRAG